MSVSRVSSGATRRFAAVLVLLLGAVLFSAAAAGPVAAQEQVEITVQPANGETPVGEETEFQLVVAGAAGGIDGYDLNVTLSDPAVAKMANVTLTGNPRFPISTLGEDGASLSLQVAMGENAHDPADEVVLATVTVVGTAAGSATLSVPADASVSGPGDEGPIDYEVTTRTNATFEVVEPTPDDGDDQTGGGGDGPGGDGDEQGNNGDDQTGDNGGDVGRGDGSSDDESGGDDGFGPGFGAVSALVALLAVVGTGARAVRAGND
jgi:PGF-CTERM protein